MPTFTCDLTATPKPFAHPWEHTVGSGHAPLALRADWQAQLARCHRELGLQHVRFHDLLSDRMGTLVCQDEQLIYSFFNADQIMDFLLSIGMRPFVELSFTPTTLASGEKTVFRYRGNVTPPRDYAQWATLIRVLVGHWVERYGVREVGRWFFEVWNEPNLADFWTGTQADYFELYRRTVEAIKSIDPSLQVGGPATAQNAWLPEFLAFCEKNRLPADFLTTHYYPTDAYADLSADTETQLAHTPRNVMRQRAEEARRHAGHRSVYYTEWNVCSNSRHHLHDEPFAAAFATHILFDVAELVDGYSYWTFSDIFEESYFPSVPFHGGFGLLTLHGIAKPVYRAFELLHRLGTELLPSHGEHPTVDAHAVRKQDTVTVVVTNHAPPQHAIRTERVSIRLTNVVAPRAVVAERIDEDHANPRRAWQEMGEPTYLSAIQVEHLHAASCLVVEPLAWTCHQMALEIDIDLPAQGMAAITFEFPPASPHGRTASEGLA